MYFFLKRAYNQNAYENIVEKFKIIKNDFKLKKFKTIIYELKAHYYNHCFRKSKNAFYSEENHGIILGLNPFKEICLKRIKTSSFDESKCGLCRKN